MVDLLISVMVRSMSANVFCPLGFGDVRASARGVFVSENTALHSTGSTASPAWLMFDGWPKIAHSSRNEETGWCGCDSVDSELLFLVGVKYHQICF